jgi:hypothetical protein
MLVDSWRAGLYLALPSHRPDDGIARVAGAQSSKPRSPSGGRQTQTALADGLREPRDLPVAVEHDE